MTQRRILAPRENAPLRVVFLSLKQALKPLRSFLYTSDTCDFACPDLESADIQAAFADAVNVAAFFLTNSRTLSGSCPVSVRTSSDSRS